VFLSGFTFLAFVEPQEGLATASLTVVAHWSLPNGGGHCLMRVARQAPYRRRL